jgi:hypothetical protein
VRVYAEEVSELLGQKLGVRGRTLEDRLRRAGRRLPKKIQREAKVLVDAAALEGHPKLARQVDPQKAENAKRACVTWLETIDPAAKRRAAIWNFLAVNAAGILIAAAAVVVVLRWRGYI